MIWRPEEKTRENLTGFPNKYQIGGLQHLPARHVLNEVGEAAFNQAYKFSMVRNPFDKIVSQYEYIKKRKDLMEHIGMSDQCPFEKYVELISKTKHIQWEAQYKFIYNENGESVVNHIMRFENFASEIAYLMNKLNIQRKEIRHDKRSTRTSMQKYYTSASYEQVVDLYSTDFKLLNYPTPSFSQAENTILRH